MIAILVFAIVFGFWVDCQVCSLARSLARAPSLSPAYTHIRSNRSLTHTHTFGHGGGGGGTAQLVSTAVADAQLLSHKNGPKHVEYVSHFLK